MISQNTSETSKISRAGTTFCGKKNGGVKHPSGVTQLVKTLRTSRWIRVAKITTSSHPTNGWEVVGKDSGGREFEYLGWWKIERLPGHQKPATDTQNCLYSVVRFTGTGEPIQS